MLNETIVCEGYANAYTRYPFKPEYMDRFRACERQAREQGKGLWREGLAGTAAASPVPVHSASTPAAGAIHGNTHSKIYHLPTCPDYTKLSEKNVIVFATEAEARQAGYRKAKNCP